MKEVAIIGVGMHPWGKFPEKSFVELGRVACQEALKDANVSWTDIQLLAAGVSPYAGMQGLLAGSTFAEEMGFTGIPVANVSNACATGGYCLDAARAYIASGLCEMVLCMGLFKAPGGFFGAMGESTEQIDLDALRFKLLGMTNPTMFAFAAQRRMHLYGTTEFDIAQVKVKNSKHGALNPYARYQREFSLEEVMTSPMVASPLRLYELAATSDGAAAMVVCSADVAKKYTTKPVYLAAVSGPSPRYPITELTVGYFGSDSTISIPPPQETHAQAVARGAYEQAGLGPEDLSLAEVYDLSTAMELDWCEDIGLCAPGEAERLLNEGATTIGGRIPVNTSGGVSAFGESIPAQALAQVCELVWQVRGDAGPRQVEGAKAGFSINRGLGGNCSAVIVKR